MIAPVTDSHGNLIATLRSVTITCSTRPPDQATENVRSEFVHFAVPVKGIMSDRSKKRERGFSLLEMIRHGARNDCAGRGGAIYIQGVSATWTVTQRAEMQQDFRAASNMLTKDLSLAGAGLGNSAAIPLHVRRLTPVSAAIRRRWLATSAASNSTR